DDPAQSLTADMMKQAGLTAELININANDLVLLAYIQRDQPQTVTDIMEALAAIQAQGPTFGAGISTLIDSLDELHLAYQQAQQAYDYSFVHGTNAIIAYETI